MHDLDELTRYTFFRGRVGLAALLRVLGVGAGDEVAVQAFTCSAVPEGVIATGALPRYVDIEGNGYNLDPDDLRRKLTSRTKAVVVQHTFGIPARLDAIMEILRGTGLPLIEDCCHTLFSTFAGKRVGAFGTGAFYSFEWGKPVIVGIGGSVVVNDDNLRPRFRLEYGNYHAPSVLDAVKLELQYLFHSALYRPERYWLLKRAFHALSRLGAAKGSYNAVETEIAEDYHLRMVPRFKHRLCRKLQNVQSSAEHSSLVSAQYREKISADRALHPRAPADSTVIYARYPLRVNNKAELLHAARKAHLELSEWYRTPVHPLAGDALRAIHYTPGSCPHAEARSEEIVSLPTHQHVGAKYIERIATLLNSYAAAPQRLRAAA